MPIDLEHGAFEPETTAAMGEAFKAACKELRDAGERELVREIIAKRIIAAARTGELDPVRLRVMALRGLSVNESWPAASHPFVAQANINHFRDRLRSETDAASRSALQKLLVQEEDKLSADFALLDDLAREIVKCQQWIERQRVLVGTLERDRRDPTTARALLNGLTESLIIHQDYRQRVATRLEQIPFYHENPRLLNQVQSSGSTGRV